MVVAVCGVWALRAEPKLTVEFASFASIVSPAGRAGWFLSASSLKLRLWANSGGSWERPGGSWEVEMERRLALELAFVLALALAFRGDPAELPGLYTSKPARSYTDLNWRLGSMEGNGLLDSLTMPVGEVTTLSGSVLKKDGFLLCCALDMLA